MPTSVSSLWSALAASAPGPVLDAFDSLTPEARAPTPPDTDDAPVSGAGGQLTFRMPSGRKVRVTPVEDTWHVVVCDSAAEPWRVKVPTSPTGHALDVSWPPPIAAEHVTATLLEVLAADRDDTLDTWGRWAR